MHLVVEVTYSFLNWFRKLLVRFEKKTDNYFTSIHFARIVIVNQLERCQKKCYQSKDSLDAFFGEIFLINSRNVR